MKIRFTKDIFSVKKDGLTSFGPALTQASRVYILFFTYRSSFKPIK